MIFTIATTETRITVTIVIIIPLTQIKFIIEK
jgi:hypothetical protein